MVARLIARAFSRARPLRTGGAVFAATAGGAIVLGGSDLHCHTGGHSGDGHSHPSLSKNFEHTHTGPTDGSHLRFAVPKKGRLYEQINNMLLGAGVDYVRKDRLDVAHCSNLPVTIVFLPTADIAKYVAEGDVDLGITGEDIVGESDVDVNVIMQLGFGKCNLSVLGLKEQKLDVKDLAGKRIVTSFPNLSRNFFRQYENGEPTQIKVISGSVEAAIGLGLADGIVDLVQTGTTARAAGLEEIAKIMNTQAVLIANPHSKHNDMIEVIRKRMEGYMTAKSWVMLSYNVARKDLPVCRGITPGKRSPTISRLEDENWVAVASLVRKSEAHSCMDELACAGARDIFLTSIHGSRMER